MIAAGIGHNSGTPDRETVEELTRLRVENNQLRAQIITITRQRDHLQRKKDYGETIMSSQLSAPAKLVGVRIVNATDEDGQAAVRNKLLAQAASVKSLTYISKVVRELKEANIIGSSSPYGPQTYHVPASIEDLQKAVEAYAETRRNRPQADNGLSVGTSSTEQLESYAGEELTSSPEQLTSSTEQLSELSHRATELFPRATDFLPRGTLGRVEGGDKGGGEFLRTPQTSEYAESTVQALRKKREASDAGFRGTRLPKDWQPDAELFAWAREHIPAYPESVLRTENENFRDWWLSKAGAGARKVDWPRTWQGWMRKAAADYANNQLRLARMSGKPVPTAAPRLRFWWQDRAKVSGMSLDRWREGIAKHANGRWPVPELGPPPGHHDCVVPRSLITELRLTEIYDEHGMKRKEGSLL